MQPRDIIGDVRAGLAGGFQQPRRGDPGDFFRAMGGADNAIMRRDQMLEDRQRQEEQDQAARDRQEGLANYYNSMAEKMRRPVASKPSKLDDQFEERQRLIDLYGEVEGERIFRSRYYPKSLEDKGEKPSPYTGKTNLDARKMGGFPWPESVDLGSNKTGIPDAQLPFDLHNAQTEVPAGMSRDTGDPGWVFPPFKPPEQQQPAPTIKKDDAGNTYQLNPETQTWEKLWDAAPNTPTATEKKTTKAQKVAGIAYAVLDSGIEDIDINPLTRDLSNSDKAAVLLALKRLKGGSSSGGIMTPGEFAGGGAPGAVADDPLGVR